VRELLAARRREVYEIFISADAERAPILEDVMSLAARAGVAVRAIPHDEIERLSLSDTPQGVIARTEPLRAVELSELTNTPADKAPPFLLALDGVTDPHNLGAVLRSALASGVSGIVLPRHRAARISATVAKAAAGAVEHLPIALVAGIPAALSTLSERAVWSVGLDAEGPTVLEDVRVLTEPLVLVLGAEGAGLAALTRARCDVLARIPLVGPLASLNVSAAGAIACFTVARHRASVSDA
jgi:23S rRNA (guanosine2251-2'-O)-methyltransferase